MKSLSAKLWAGFGGLLLIVVLVSALSVAVLTRYSHALERVFRENYDSAMYCDAMRSALESLDVAAQRRVWGAEQGSDEAVTTQQSKFDDALSRQLQNCTLPGELELSQQLRARWLEFKAAWTGFWIAPAEARASRYRRDLLPRYQQLKQTAQRVAEMNMANMVSVDGQAKRTLVDVRDTVVVLVSIGTLLAAVLVAAIGAAVLRPMKLLTNCAQQIGTGNLDLSIQTHAADEVGKLVEAFNAMAAQLREFRRLDHEKLARARQTTQLAIDSLPDAVLMLTPDGIVEISNRTAQEHFNISPGTTVQGLGLEWLDRLHAAVVSDRQPLDPEGYASAIQIFEQGRERFLLPRAMPVLDGKSSLIGITIVLVDVTRLRHADELKSGLLSTVSHELRTPLTSIRMALSLLTGEKLGSLGGSHRRLISIARDDTDRLYRTIENLLNLGRLESGRAETRPRSMAAAEVINAAVEPLRHAFEQKGLELSIDGAFAQEVVWADPNSLGYALTNLLTNALKFTPSGGNVKVSCEPLEGFVRFVVADTGPGIPPEFTGRVFEKYFRLPREQAKAGAGLGLTIARQIVEANGGCISFRPGPGGGSEFSFTVPMPHVPSPPAPVGRV